MAYAQAAQDHTDAIRGDAAMTSSETITLFEGEDGTSTDGLAMTATIYVTGGCHVTVEWSDFDEVTVGYSSAGLNSALSDAHDGLVQVIEHCQTLLAHLEENGHRGGAS